MRKDKRTPEKKAEDLSFRIRMDFMHWKHMKRFGSHDPHWPDGTNMNLVRNHILHDQGELLELCKSTKLKCPKEARLKPPKKVSEDYMHRKRKRK